MTQLITRLQDLAMDIGSQVKKLETQINGNVTDLTALTTSAKSNLVASINELKGAITVLQNSTPINDAATAASTTWSSNKILSQIVAQANATVASLTNGAPAALDTLKEFADAIGNDSSFAATITTALSNRIRFDAAQTLTAPQKAQAKSNIDAYGSVEIGAYDTDLVAIFRAGLT